MYKSYKAYAGNYPSRDRITVDQALADINERGEYIVSVSAITEAALYVLIITQEPEELQESVLEGSVAQTLLPDAYLGAMTREEIMDAVIEEINKWESRRGRK